MWYTFSREYVVKVGFSLRTHYETFLRKCLNILKCIVMFKLLEVAPDNGYKTNKL